MRDPGGWWVAYFGNIQAIICNKNRVKNAPNDWKDFLDPKWKGEFSIDDTRYEWFYALQKIYGDQEANRLITGFRQNGVNLRRGGTLRAQLVGAGEESCGLGVYLNNVRDLSEQSAPVNYAVPEPVLVVPVINMALSGAQTKLAECSGFLVDFRETEQQRDRERWRAESAHRAAVARRFGIGLGGYAVHGGPQRGG